MSRREYNFVIVILEFFIHGANLIACNNKITNLESYHLKILIVCNNKITNSKGCHLKICHDKGIYIVFVN